MTEDITVTDVTPRITYEEYQEIIEELWKRVKDAVRMRGPARVAALLPKTYIETILPEDMVEIAITYEVKLVSNDIRQILGRIRNP